MYVPLENQKWVGRKNGDYVIKNITSHIDMKSGKREFYIMLDYRQGWIKVCIDREMKSYIRKNGQRLYLKDFVYENVYETVKA